MADRTPDKEIPDRFSNYIRQRLTDHPTSVEPDCWEHISAQMKRRRISRVLWLAAGIAASLLVGILLIPMSSDKNDATEEWISDNQSALFIEEKEESQEIALSVPVAEIYTPAQTSVQAKPRVSVNIPVTEKKEITDSVENPADPDNKTEDVVDQTPKTESKTADKQPLKTEKQNKYQTKSKTAVSRKKETGSWLLAAAFGTGGGSSPGNNAPFPETNTSPDLFTHSEDPEGIPLISAEPPVEKDADISHSIPISVGVTLRKDFNRHFAIESGLFYTYLSSDLKMRGIHRKSEKLEHHYLGIPVNVIGYVINRSQWNLYVSGGIMLEKGLRSVSTEKTYFPDRVETMTTRRSISGIQVSLNGAVGVGYRFTDQWSLYAEPKLYYYFDTDQPLSVRTERPFGFGINAGLRYHF